MPTKPSLRANGGFDLVAESDLPLFRDLNIKEGRQEVQEKLLPIYRDESGGDNARPSGAPRNRPRCSKG